MSNDVKDRTTSPAGITPPDAAVTAIKDRDIRQREIIPPEALAECRATVVGVGAIGRQVAIQLAAIGVPDLHLVDFDTVEDVNLGPQGYLERDIGDSKVHATAALCREINSEIALRVDARRFSRSMNVGNILFCCVDSMDAREFIWDIVGASRALWVDARMSAEAIRILTVSNAGGYDYYPTTLFSNAEAYQGSCTAKSTIYTANIAAGLMLSQFTKWLRRFHLNTDISLNVLACEIDTAITAIS